VDRFGDSRAHLEDLQLVSKRTHHLHLIFLKVMDPDVGELLTPRRLSFVPISIL